MPLKWLESKIFLTSAQCFPIWPLDRLWHTRPKNQLQCLVLLWFQCPLLFSHSTWQSHLPKSVHLLSLCWRLTSFSLIPILPPSLYTQFSSSFVCLPLKVKYSPKSKRNLNFLTFPPKNSPATSLPTCHSSEYSSIQSFHWTTTIKGRYKSRHFFFPIIFKIYLLYSVHTICTYPRPYSTFLLIMCFLPVK